MARDESMIRKEVDDMRRKDREITERAEMIRVMERCDVCRLALHDEGYPYIVPLNFGVEVTGDGVILYFHGATEGKKYERMAADNRASFEMDCSHRLVTDEQKRQCTMEYESIIGRGRLEIVPDEEKLHGLQVLMAHYHKEDFVFGREILPATTVFRLTVEEMTGKRRMVKP